MIRLGLLTGFVTALVLVAITSSVVHADPTVNCTITEIRATLEKKGVGPQLERFKGKLTHAPFTSWDTFILLGEQSVAAELHHVKATKTQHGTLSLLYKDMLSERGGRPRLRFGVDVDDEAGKRIVSTTVVFDSGENVLIAGASPKPGATYIIALGCVAP